MTHLPTYHSNTAIYTIINHCWAQVSFSR